MTTSNHTSRTISLKQQAKNVAATAGANVPGDKKLIVTNTDEAKAVDQFLRARGSKATDNKKLGVKQYGISSSGDNSGADRGGGSSSSGGGSGSSGSSGGGHDSGGGDNKGSTANPLIKPKKQAAPSATAQNPNTTPVQGSSKGSSYYSDSIANSLGVATGKSGRALTASDGTDDSNTLSRSAAVGVSQKLGQSAGVTTSGDQSLGDVQTSRLNQSPLSIKKRGPNNLFALANLGG